MKKLIIYGLLTCTLFSCEKFLDVIPTTNITIPTNLENYKALIYPPNAVYGYCTSNSFCGDDLFYTDKWYRSEPYSEAERNAYIWKDVIYDAVTRPTVWNNTYSYIYALNKVIDEVPSLNDVEIAKQEVIAHAKMMRAWQYFHLVNTYGKPYHMANDNDLSIPYITENDVMKNALEQSSVKSIYANILDDLDFAIDNLGAFPSVNSRYMACKVSALSLKAKVLFYMCKYKEALEIIKETFYQINNNVAPNNLKYEVLDFRTAVNFIDENATYRGLNPNFPTNTSFLNDVENIFASIQNLYSPASGFYFGFMGLNACYVSDMALSLYNSRPGDLRKAYWLFDKNTGGLPWDSANQGRFLKKNYGARIGVTYPELLLMAAECYARENNLPKALENLEKLRVKRYKTTEYVTLSSTDKNTIIKWCIEERIREFVAQGHRWWDIRRLWDDEVGSQTIIKTRTVEGKSYTLTKERLTFRFPEQIMEYNKSWSQNP
ncbi:MAG: RagB/SusD family nutrient uptake outer membrane protein [Bacteroidales bacterium]